MSALLAPCAAFLATGLALPVLAARVGLLDVPGARSTHARPVARVGGLAVALGLAVGVGAAAAHGALDDARGWLAVLLPAAAFLGIGLWDDRRGLPPRRKFALQALAAAGAVALGLRWEGAAAAPFGALAFGVLTPVMTWLWIVAVVTVLNLIDGLDLIAACTAVVVLAAAAGGGAGPQDGLLYALALAALLGFVPWNLRPARAFLGDAGTHLLGFLVATAALRVPGAGHALPWAWASAPLVPAVLDLAWGLALKRRHGVPLARAHDQHPSQRLVHAGRTHAAVALRYGALACAALGVVAWVGPRAGWPGVVGLGGAVLAWHGSQALWAARRIPVRFEEERP